MATLLNLYEEQFFDEHVEVMCNDVDNEIEVVLDEEAKILMCRCYDMKVNLAETWQESMFADQIIARIHRYLEETDGNS